jgi:membrane protease YdiL (CAAX protease family)
VALRLIQFLAIMLTALALVPSGAHLAALPNKMAMGQAAYFIAQQAYAGWALFGIVLFGALAANLAHAIALRKLGRSFGYALASFFLIAASLVIFFVWTLPTNQATSNWTFAPKNWNELRIQWEYSHAANAVVTLAAFVCVVIAALRQPGRAK